MNNKTKISFTDKHLVLIKTALEIYYRMKSGQISMALDEVYPEKFLSWDEREDIEKFIRNIVFPDLHPYYDHVHKDEERELRDDRKGLTPNAYFGVGNKELGDANLAYEIEKTITQYLSVKNNNRYWKVNCSFYDPLKVTDEPLPEIEGFNKWIDFPLTIAQSKKILKYYTKKDYFKMWQEYDKLELDLPKSEKKEIIPVFVEDNISVKKIIIRCHKPQKKDLTV